MKTKHLLILSDLVIGKDHHRLKYKVFGDCMKTRRKSEKEIAQSKKEETNKHQAERTI